METIKNVIIETRPMQWVKNLTIFAFLVFSKEFFIKHQFLVVLEAFGIFTLLTSSIYIINDIIDLPSDKKSPEKKNRPIASGKLPIPLAVILGGLFALASFFLAYTLSEDLLVLCIVYWILMILYSLYLKNVAIIDALVIAGGFVIRVMAGAFVINVSNLYSWLVVLTISVSLLLAFGKRRSEITLLGHNRSEQQRKVLSEYPVELLNSLISALIASCFLAYVLLTFQMDSTPAGTILQTNFLHLPATLLRTTHLLKITIPVVFYGLARYLYIIYTKKNAGTPEKVLFKDIPLLTTVLIWIILLFTLLYVA